jgi:hypothetical protein
LSLSGRSDWRWTLRDWVGQRTVPVSTRCTSTNLAVGLAGVAVELPHFLLDAAGAVGLRVDDGRLDEARPRWLPQHGQENVFCHPLGGEWMAQRVRRRTRNRCRSRPPCGSELSSAWRVASLLRPSTARHGKAIPSQQEAPVLKAQMLSVGVFVIETATDESRVISLFESSKSLP